MKAFKKIILLTFTAACMLLYQNCTPFKGIPGESTSSSEFSFFVGLYERVIEPKCLDCHNSVVSDGGLNLETYSSILSSGTVNAGNALTSSLYTVLVDALVPAHATVTQAELDGLANWINAGAIENEIPVVNAGADIVVRLPASTTTITPIASDIDGEIVSYLWEQISGPNTATFANPSTRVANLSGLVEGAYNFSVTVTDNSGATAIDTINVSVTLAANVLPTVTAGADRALTLPTNSLTFTATASDSDGTISSYLWTLVSGPNVPTLAGDTTTALTASNLVMGTYIFNILVTDNRGGTANDTVSVVVSVAAPTYTELNNDIFINKCSSCHNNAIARGNYSMASYADTLTKVVPNNANGSPLFISTNNNSMPPGNPLSATEKAKIRDWINSGAPNN